MSDALLTRLLSMSRAIAGEIDRQSVLDKVTEELRHLIPHDHLDLAMLVDDGRLNITYEVGIDTGWTQPEVTPHPVARAPVREVLWGHVPYLLTGDAPNDERFHFDGALNKPIFDAELRSRLHVPLRVHGRVIGSLNISRHEPNRYDEQHVRIAQDVADILAPYLRAIARAEEARQAAVAKSEATAREEMLRLGALRLTEGMEHERQRLGMDLHDQTLADLTRLTRQVGALRDRERVLGAELENLEAGLATCLQELRAIIEDTKPGVLQLFGFREAVEALLLRSVEGVSPPIATGIDDRSDGVVDRLPDAVRTSLYRIVQEAVNNAVNHAEPRAIHVELHGDETHLHLVVSDDGCGLDTGVVHNSSGIGHMRTRATLLSASFEVDSFEDRPGTRVSLRMPVTELLRPARGAAADTPPHDWADSVVGASAART
jgi:signal transduction histidine kinase